MVIASIIIIGIECNDERNRRYDSVDQLVMTHRQMVEPSTLFLVAQGAERSSRGNLPRCFWFLLKVKPEPDSSAPLSTELGPTTN